MPCTVVGFTAELDWRPLHFVSPIPRTRLCSACGLVRKKTALLQCSHVLCESCYEQCANDGERLCPLDGLKCLQGDVTWIEFSVEELLGREVRCWNEQAGCGALLPASELIGHVLRDCEHHCTSCQRCSSTILCSNFYAHLRSDCRRLILSEAHKGTQHSKETATSTTFEKLFHERAGEMRAALLEVVQECKTQSQSLNEINHGMNTLRDALDGKFAEAAEQTQESFAQNAADVRCSVLGEVKGRFNAVTCTLTEISQAINSLKQTINNDIAAAKTETCEKIEANAVKFEALQMRMRQSSETTLRPFERILAHSSLNTHFTYFSLGELSTKKEIVMKEGSFLFTCKPLYLRGYNMSPGVYLEKKGSSVSLHIWIHLLKGAIDDVLRWPFSHTLKISVIHPVSGEVKADTHKPGKSTRIFFSKPAGIMNACGKVNLHAFLLSDLECHGYVEENQLLLKYELL